MKNCMYLGRKYTDKKSIFTSHPIWLAWLVTTSPHSKNQKWYIFQNFHFTMFSISNCITDAELESWSAKIAEYICRLRMLEQQLLLTIPRRNFEQLALQLWVRSQSHTHQHSLSTHNMAGDDVTTFQPITSSPQPRFHVASNLDQSR